MLLNAELIEFVESRRSIYSMSWIHGHVAAVHCMAPTFHKCVKNTKSISERIATWGLMTFESCAEVLKKRFRNGAARHGMLARKIKQKTLGLNF